MIFASVVAAIDLFPVVAQRVALVNFSFMVIMFGNIIMHSICILIIFVTIIVHCLLHPCLMLELPSL
jgi:hypothetical protein